MKPLTKYTIIISLLIFSNLTATALTWYKDIDRAKEKARRRNKCILLVYLTYSDTHQKRLDKLVLRHSTIEDFIKKHFVPVKIGAKMKLSGEERTEIKRQKAEYNVKYTPKIIILDTLGNELFRYGETNQPRITRLKDPDILVDHMQIIMSNYYRSISQVTATDTNNVEQASVTTNTFPVRTWTNTKGKQVEGRLIEFDAETAVIMNIDGKKCRVSRNILSQDDNNYIDTVRDRQLTDEYR
jgi:hypothetical protein